MRKLFILSLLAGLVSCEEAALCQSSKCPVDSVIAVPCESPPCTIPSAWASGNKSPFMKGERTPAEQGFDFTSSGQNSYTVNASSNVTFYSLTIRGLEFKQELIIDNILVDGSLTFFQTAVETSCSSLQRIQQFFCSDQAPADSLPQYEVTPGRVLIVGYADVHVSYQNVLITCPIEDQQQYPPPCMDIFLHSGQGMEMSIKFLQQRMNIIDFKGVVKFTLNESISFNQGSIEPFVITRANVTVRGHNYLQTTPVIDMAFASGALFLVGSKGRINFENVAFKNLRPSSPESYPLGLITSFLWGVTFLNSHNRNTIGLPETEAAYETDCLEGLCLVLRNSTLYVTNTEYKYLWDILPKLQSYGTSNATYPYEAVGPVRPSSQHDQFFTTKIQAGIPLALKDVVPPSWVFESSTLKVATNESTGEVLLAPDGVQWLFQPSSRLEGASPEELRKFQVLSSPSPEFIQFVLFNTPYSQLDPFKGPRFVMLATNLFKLNKTSPVQIHDHMSENEIRQLERACVGCPTIRSPLTLVGDLWHSDTVLDLSYMTTPNLPKPLPSGSQGSISGFISVDQNQQLFLRSLIVTGLDSVKGLREPYIKRSIQPESNSLLSALESADDAPPDYGFIGGRRALQSLPIKELPVDDDRAGTDARRGLMQNVDVQNPFNSTTEEDFFGGENGGNNGMSGQDFAELLGNYTSMLWLFNIQRAVQPSNHGEMEVHDVKFILPAIELQAMREIIIFNRTSVNIDPEAEGVLINEIDGPMKVNAILTRSVNDRECGVDPSAHKFPPGDIVFPVFNWFGITGRNITWSASDPISDINTITSGLITPHYQQFKDCISAGSDQADNGSDQADNAEEPDPPPPRPLRRENIPPLDGETRNSGWVIGIAVGVAVIVVLLAIVGFLVIRHYKARKKGRMLSPLSSTDMDAEGAPDSRHRKHFPRSSTHTATTTTFTGSGTRSGTAGGGPVRMATGELMSAIFRNDDLASQQGSDSDGFDQEGDKLSCSSDGSERNADGAHMDLRIAMQKQLDSLNRGQQNFEIHSMLGKGAFGVVYKGTWRGLEVAVKRIIFQVMGAEGDTHRQTALQEAAINASLNHPNIVTTYSYDMKPLGQHMSCTHTIEGEPTKAVPKACFDDWQLHIIQELCDGGSLYDAIEGHMFSDVETGGPHLNRVLAVAADIANGMNYIHSRNIIHGDLKPDNVLLKSLQATTSTPSSAAQQPWESVAKVADFGLSLKMQNNQTHISGVKHGTPFYVAPEILKNGKTSKASDVYSFGVILWELYHGQSAWQYHAKHAEGGGQGRLMYSHELFDFKNCTMPSYAALGLACTAKKPRDRPNFLAIANTLAAIRTAENPSSLRPIEVTPSVCCSVAGTLSPAATASAGLGSSDFLGSSGVSAEGSRSRGLGSSTSLRASSGAPDCRGLGSSAAAGSSAQAGASSSRIEE